MTKKILVAYYSKSGNTGRVAKEIASQLRADIEAIIDKKSRTGVFGFILGGRDAMRKIGTEIGTLKYDPAGYDLVIVGTPVWGGNMAPAVRTYLGQNKEKIKNIACFDTSGGTAPEAIAASVEEAAGKKPAAFTGFTASELKNEKIYREKLDGFISAQKF